MVQVTGFRAQGSGFRVQGSGFRGCRTSVLMRALLVGSSPTVIVRSGSADTATTFPRYTARPQHSKSALSEFWGHLLAAIKSPLWSRVDDYARVSHEHQLSRSLPRYTAQFKNNYSAEMWSGSDEGSYLRLIDCCITQL